MSAVSADVKLTQAADLGRPTFTQFNPTLGRCLLGILVGQRFPATWVKNESAPTLERSGVVAFELR